MHVHAAHAVMNRTSDKVSVCAISSRKSSNKSRNVFNSKMNFESVLVLKRVLNLFYHLILKVKQTFARTSMTTILATNGARMEIVWWRRIG